MSNDPKTLRDIIRSEYKKCLENPMYFMKKYVKIQHPKRGTIPFELYPFQDQSLQEIIENDYNIILKSRQLGITTLSSAYSLWLMIFHSDKNILCISITQETSKEIVTRVRFANDNLPSWLKVPCIEDNRLSLRLKNGSQIKAVSSSGTAGRSAALSMLIIDEAAFIDNIDEIWTSSQSTLSTGGKAIVLSCVTDDTYVFTPKGLKQVKDFIPNNRLVGDYEVPQYSVLGVGTTRTGALFKNSGITDTIEIKTKFGNIEGSKIHKLWAYKSDINKYGWYKLEELTTDDYVSIQYGMNLWDNNDYIDFNPIISNKIKTKFKVEKITKELAYLFGLYISEGCAGKSLNSNGELVGGSITITCGDADITWVFDALGLNYYTNDNMHYTISSKLLIELFEYLGFDLSVKAHGKIIPHRLLELSRENIIYILKGIFDGDGSASKGNISLISTSKNLINQVRLLLNNFGILCSTFDYSKDQMNSYKSTKIKHNHDSHVLEIYGKNALKYFNIIGFCINRKNEKKKLLLNQNLNRNCSHDVIPGSIDIVKDLYEKSGENTSYFKKNYGLYLNGIVNKKTQYKTNHISRSIVQLLYDNYKNKLTNDVIENYDHIISNNIAWVKISKISYNKKEVFDFSLPDIENDHWCHSVIYNGFIGHQTPNGVGNFFHRTWVDATSKKNKFHTIRLPWHLHPERDQTWRDEQTKLLGPKMAAQECDCLWGKSEVVVRDKNTGEVYKISLENLYSQMS